MVQPGRVSSLLIPAQQLSAITGHTLESASSASTVLDAASEFPTRPECASAIYPLEKYAYGNAGHTAAQQNISQTAESAAYFLVDQSVASFPSAAAATKFLDTSKQQWQACTGAPVVFANQGGTNTVATLANVSTNGNTITQNRTVEGGGYTCQHSMGVWSNVVAEAVACGEGDITGKSEAVVAAILSKAQA
nr:sensor domain-containing protein [Antrihabitans stalactiti]